MMTSTTQDFRNALSNFKRATTRLSDVWQGGGAPDDVLGDTYPSYLPSFDEFNADVVEMDPDWKPRPKLPQLPAVGIIVRARHDLDLGGHGPWPKGWTGEIVDVEPDAQHLSVQAHRYLGPNVHEWDNCCVLTIEDAMCAYENDFDRQAADDDQPMSGVLAYALLARFEVLG